jgi:N-acetylneuraminic acid mutarotase
LSDGRVLVAGGYSQGGSSKSTASAEVYDPSSGSWKAVGKMVAIRIGRWTATLLTDGKLLVVGGVRSGGNGVLASGEIYDPGSRTWTAAPNMATPRVNQTATLLPDGRVLVAGGMSVIDGTARPQVAAELYDPGSGH